MLAILTQIITFGTSALSIGKLLAVAVPLLVSTHAAAYLIGHVIGGKDQQIRQAKRDTDTLVVHGRGLTELAEQSNNDALEAARLAADNRMVERGIDDETARTADSGICLSAGFLRQLGQLR